MSFRRHGAGPLFPFPSGRRVDNGRLRVVIPQCRAAVHPDRFGEELRGLWKGSVGFVEGPFAPTKMHWFISIIILIGITDRSLSFTMKNSGDFVENVSCHARGMDVTLKARLPPPRDGMWDLGVDGHPECPGATKSDVGGGYHFSILYVDKEWCGVEPKSWFTPAWVSYAEVVLVLRDQNGTKIADSVSCVYNTRFETSLLTFRGEVTSENLRYGGSIEEEGTDVEEIVRSGDAVHMDFYGNGGQLLDERRVKLGDPLVFRISVKETDHVTSVLPETCYFSSSSSPDENPSPGQTLVFIRESCFNERNGMVRTFLPKMERNFNGTVYELPFPAFHFSEHGQNLFVHCTLLACVGRQQLCEPQDNCFGSNRRKRSAIDDQMQTSIGPENVQDITKEFVMTKYIIVQDETKLRDFVNNAPRPVSAASETAVCMQTMHFAALLGSLAAMALSLLVITSCLIGRMAHAKERPSYVGQRWLDDKLMLYGTLGSATSTCQQPPPYGVMGSAQNVSTITSF